MNKTLKFRPHLVSFIRAGAKTTTWRLFDEKNLQKGDIVDLVEFGSLDTFATAEITDVEEKKLSELTEEDKAGHEGFENDEQMYQTYSTYYNKPVTPDTLVKVIKFELKN